MSKLKELKTSILADGIIDEQEVKQLREILYEDGKIDYEEAEFIFELKDAVSDKTNQERWKTFFINAISENYNQLGEAIISNNVYKGETLFIKAEKSEY